MPSLFFLLSRITLYLVLAGLTILYLDFMIPGAFLLAFFAGGEAIYSHLASRQKKILEEIDLRERFMTEDDAITIALLGGGKITGPANMEEWWIDRQGRLHRRFNDTEPWLHYSAAKEVCFRLKTK